MGAGFLPQPGGDVAPHHGFLTYHPATDCWAKLDVLVALGYGPGRLLRFAALDDWLRRRVHTGRYYEAPVDARFLKLLLHVVLHRRDLPTPGADELVRRYEATEADKSALAHARRTVRHYLSPALSWEVIASSVENRSWSELQSRRNALLRQMFISDPGGSIMRTFRVLSRKAFRPFRRRRGYSVALIAPDGAGKSTLAKLMCNVAPLKATSIYAGDGGGMTAFGVKDAAKAEVRSSRPQSGLEAAIARYPGRLAREWYRAWKVHRATSSGRTIVLDRCLYDRELHAGTTQVAKLKRKVLHLWWRSPDLVILLDAPGDVLYARKGEHSPEWLEAQRQAYRRLVPSLPCAAVVDASSPLDEVRRKVTHLIWEGYATAGSSPKSNGSLRHQHV
jgi:thymidylate kinase